MYIYIYRDCLPIVFSCRFKGAMSIPEPKLTRSLGVTWEIRTYLIYGLYRDCTPLFLLRPSQQNKMRLAQLLLGCFQVAFMLHISLLLQRNNNSCSICLCIYRTYYGKLAYAPHQQTSRSPSAFFTARLLDPHQKRLKTLLLLRSLNVVGGMMPEQSKI